MLLTSTFYCQTLRDTCGPIKANSLPTRWSWKSREEPWLGQIAGQGHISENQRLEWGQQHSAIGAFSFPPHENCVEQSSPSPFYRGVKRGSGRLSGLLRHCLRLVHGGFRSKCRSIRISNWCSVSLRLPIMNSPTWCRGGGVRRRDAVLIFHPILPVFFPPLLSP